jgi:hypothetical protein
MTRRRLRVLAAWGLLAPACSPAPTAHRGARSSANPPAEAGPDTTAAAVASSAGPAPSTSAGAASTPASTDPTTTDAPTTTVTVTLPPTTRAPRTTTTFVVPERVDEDLTDIEWLIRQTFPETPDKAVRVARCESTLDPTAVSPDGANWGLMQVNVVHKALAARMGYSWAQMLEAGPNLAVARAVARAVYDRAGGWGPWSCA